MLVYDREGGGATKQPASTQAINTSLIQKLLANYANTYVTN